MNAIAFTREVRAVEVYHRAALGADPVSVPRRLLFSAVLAAILRGAQESARTSG
jgi:hypothetical protein